MEINLSKVGVRSISGAQDTFLMKYKDINFLNLSHNFLSTLPGCFQMDCVKSLSLHSNKLVSINLVKSMASLIELNLSSNLLTTFPDAATIMLLPSIKKLFLQNNQITAVTADSLKALGTRRIEVLNLSYNRIGHLPQEIGLLVTLTSLNLSENELEELPTTILLLPHLYEPATRFDVHGNKLIRPPQQIADRNGLKSIREHLNGKKTKPTEENLSVANNLRMVVVGHEGAGKSHLVKKLGTAIVTSEGVQSNDALKFLAEDSNGIDRQGSHIPYTLQLEQKVRDHFLSSLPEKERVDFAPVININIYDFVGQEIYHAISEMFFSVSSLHLVAFNLAQINTAHDCDVYVQYWIDLIQARSPGCSIILVATRVDLVSNSPGEIQRRIDIVKGRIAHNESLRIKDLKRDIKGADANHKPALKRLLDARPQVFPDIVAYSNDLSYDPTTRSLKDLIGQISVLASPRASNPYPFRIINIDLLEHYLLVRLMLTRMRTNYQRHYCTIRELHEMVRRFYRSTWDRPEYGMTDPQGEFEKTKNAIVHWAAVGEVQCINNASTMHTVLQIF